MFSGIGEPAQIDRRIVRDTPTLMELPLYHTFKGTHGRHWNVVFSRVDSTTRMPHSLRPLRMQMSLDAKAFEKVQEILRSRKKKDEQDEIAR